VGRGRASQGSVDGVRGAPRVLRTGRARPCPGSLPHGERSRRGSGGRSGKHGAWRGEADREGYACGPGRGRRERIAAIRWESAARL
jgi:hypothetical protein